MREAARGAPGSTSGEGGRAPERPTRALRRRAVAVVALLGVALALLGGRLVKLQVVDGAIWKARASKQQLPIYAVPAYRGDIRTADGVVLARSVRCRSAFAEPRRMGRRLRKGRRLEVLAPTADDYREAAQRIAWALGYDPRREHQLLERLSHPDHQAFCFIERRLSEERAEALEAARIPGVTFKSEYRRSYPCGALAAQLLGFTEISGDGELLGRTGLESAFELYLKGSEGRREVVRDGRRRTLLTEDSLILAPEDGASVTLTIDSRIQAVAEAEMLRCAEAWHPEGIAVVVLEPSSGRVLALASWPPFDPNDLGALEPEEFGRAMRNRPLMDPFEPGSTLKPFVMAEALARGTVRSDQIIDCSGPLVVAGKSVTDVHRHGRLSVLGVLAKSSNVGMVKVGLSLGPEGIHNVLERAGFGAATGLGLEPEERGSIPALARWKTYTTRSVSQGYALMVTPLQLASAFSAFATGGVRYAPQLIESVRDARGRYVQRLQPRIVARVADERLCREVLVPALQQVVEDGTAKSVRLSRWTAAGKTGTAMKVVNGRYVSRYRSSFVGFAPVEAPRLVALAMVDDASSPDGRKPYGGTVAGPIVRQIFEEALPYLRVPPSPGKEPAEAP